MIQRVDVIGTTDASGWESVLAAFPSHLQDIHFTARYHRMYEANGDGTAMLFVYREADETYAYPFLCRPVPSGLIDGDYFDIESAYGYGGPLSTTTDPSFLHAADQAFRNFTRERSIVTEFVRFHPLIGNHGFVAGDSGLKVVHLRDYVAVNLRVPETELLAGYTSQNRNKIRKAEKSGVVITQDMTMSRFDEFIRIYIDNMRQLGASSLYFFSEDYFAGLRELLKTDGMLYFADGTSGCLGAAAFLHNNTWAHYFLSSATPEGKKLAAGNALLHAGIIACRQRGCATMHLGGGLTGTEDDALLVFKRNFSSMRVPYYIGKRIHLDGVYQRIMESWDRNHPGYSQQYSSILQRYRWKSGDFPQNR